MYDEPSLSSSEEQAAAPLPSTPPDAGTPAAAQEQPVGDADIPPSGSVPLFPQAEAPFYTIEGNTSDEASVAAPFQFSGALHTPAGPSPDAAQASRTGTTPPAVPQAQQPRWLRPLMWGLALLVVALLLVGSIIGLAASPRALQTTGAARPTAPVNASAPKGPPSPAPTSPTTPTSSWSLSPLPAGWMGAGLSRGDAAFAMRTAITFTDREMSLDSRNIGTRAIHSGTLTAATFLLTAAARTRFAHNDVRVANNVLFDRLTSEQMIQAVVDETPQVVRFQTQGGQQLAWVEVSFHLWQERKDPAHPGGRIEGLETDPASGQPRLHHMSVLLLRVAPGTQGPTAPMGGTGWLVSNYGLDLAGGTLVDLVEPA